MFRLNGLYFHDYFREKMIVKVINILPFSLKFQSSKYVDSLAVLSGQLLWSNKRSLSQAILSKLHQMDHSMIQQTKLQKLQHKSSIVWTLYVSKLFVNSYRFLWQPNYHHL